MLSLPIDAKDRSSTRSPLVEIGRTVEMMPAVASRAIAWRVCHMPKGLARVAQIRRWVSISRRIPHRASPIPARGAAGLFRPLANPCDVVRASWRAALIGAAVAAVATLPGLGVG